MSVAWDIVARALLFPLLIWQGKSVRRTALIMPEPPGARHGIIGEGLPIRMLILGDSSGAGVGAMSQDQALAGQLTQALAKTFTVHWRLEAQTGATTASSLARLEQIKPETFDITVVALGVNDVTGMVATRRWVHQQVDLHRQLKARFGVDRIYASGVPPMGQLPLLPQPLRWVLGAHATRLDVALAGLAARDDTLRHVRFLLANEARFYAADGFHPSPDAYALWAQTLVGAIKKDQLSAG